MISPEQIYELVRLYSEFHGAIDPTEPVVLRAEIRFHEYLQELHAADAADLEFHRRTDLNGWGDWIRCGDFVGDKRVRWLDLVWY